MLRKLKDFTRKLRAGADAAIGSAGALQQIHAELVLARLGQTERFKDPLRLLSSGYKVYSQNHEDGMIAEVFRRIGEGNRRFIEFGVENGLECNSAFLVLQGWSGAWIEGSPASAKAAGEHFAGYPVNIVNSYITLDNADAMIADLAGGPELDLLSIDIDSIDYWIWDAIRTVKPRLVVIEYNATLPPHVRKTVPSSPARGWDGSNHFGASLGALAELGRRKGYSLVGCTLAGVNAFFVRDDLVGDHFCAPFTAENHYEPARYYLNAGSGHRAGFGPWVEV